MSIVIDAREPTRIMNKLKKDMDVKSEYLEIGDYLLNGSVCIERKTIRDFISSIKDKRIWTQAKNLQQYDHAIIAVIGSPADKWKSLYHGRSKWMHKSYTSTMSTLACKFNVSVMSFEDEKDFLDFLEAAHKKVTSDKKSSRPSPLVKKATNDNERSENNLCAVPGVSIQKAQVLLKHFGTIKRIANAGVNELQHCQGIGKKLANNIYKLYNHEYKEE